METKRTFRQTGMIVDADQDQAVYEHKRRDVANQAHHLQDAIRTLATSAAVLVASVVVLIAFLVGVLGNLQQYLATSSAAMKFLLQWFVPGMIGAAVLYCLVKLYRAWKTWRFDSVSLKRAQAEIEDMNDARTRANWLAEAEVEVRMAEALKLRAEAIQIERAINFDANGNAAILNVATWEVAQFRGNYQQYPNLHTIRNDNQLQAGTQANELQTSIAEERELPSIERFYEAIPFNSLQTGLGAEVANGQLVIAPIRKSTHFKFIGGSGQGKSCVAGGVLDIAMTTNDPDHLRIGLLDLEHNTSRLFEDMPHVAEIGPRRQRLVGRDADEVANKLKLLQWELNRRSQLGEEYCTQHEPVLLVYVEEMLALKYEVVDKKLQKEMLAALNLISIRGRKYGIYFLTCMQTDYSDKDTREGMAQFRTRGGFAIDPEVARASGFINTELVKQNFLTGKSGQYVLERPQYSGLVLAPNYDVRAKLEARANKKASATRPAITPTIEGSISRQNEREMGAYEVANVPTTPVRKSPTTGALQAPLTAQEWRIVEKWRSGMGMNKIIASEYTNSKGEPLTGGDLFTQRAKEIQQLIGRFLPTNDGNR